MILEVVDPRIEIEYYIIAVVIAALIVFIGWRKRNIAAKAALVVYMFLVLASTIFSRPVASERVALIVPCWSIVKVLQTGSTGMALEILLNILMLMPVGFLLPFAFKNVDGWGVLFTALIFSAIIEFSQLIFKRGWFETDDILNNTMGAVIGWLLYYISTKIKTDRKLSYKPIQ